jgi:hypothetical protein
MARVSSTHKFIYVSGGRNATGAINAALEKIPGVKMYEPAKKSKKLWNKFNKHAPARSIRNIIGEQAWNQYYSFTFVRNTYSWVISSVGFWFKIGRLKKPKDGYLTMDHFREAVRYYRTAVGRRHDECSDIRSQHSFICDTNGKVMVNYVGQFENLQNDFNVICKQMGVKPISLTVQNSSMASLNKKHSMGIPWQEHYRRNPEAKDYVYHHWKRDIDAFNFKLEL